MTGHVWQEYGSETLRSARRDPNAARAGARAAAATTATSRCSACGRTRRSCTTTRSGPELCGKPENAANDFYRSPYVDCRRQVAAGRQGAGVLGRTTRACRAASSSTRRRWRSLLNPAQRVAEDHEVQRRRADRIRIRGRGTARRKTGARLLGGHDSRRARAPARSATSSTSASSAISSAVQAASDELQERLPRSSAPNAARQVFAAI